MYYKKYNVAKTARQGVQTRQHYMYMTEEGLAI